MAGHDYRGHNSMGIRYRFESPTADNLKPEGAVFKGCAMNWRSMIPFRKDIYEAADQGEPRFFSVKDIEVMIADGRLRNAPYVDVQNGIDAERALAALRARYSVTAG